MAQGSPTHFTSLRQGCSSPSAGRSKHVLRYQTLLSSTSASSSPELFTPPFYNLQPLRPRLFFFCGLGEKQAGSHSGTSGTQLFGYELLTPVFPQRTDKVLIVALSTSGASVGGPLGAPRTAKKKPSRSDAYDGLSACALSELLARQRLP